METSMVLNPVNLATGIMDFISAKKNRDAQVKMNEQNIAMQRETNEQMERMNNANNAFTRNSALEMFNLENQYNSPEAQRKRFLEAGMNPFQSGSSLNNVPADGASAASVATPSLQAPKGVAPQLNFVPSQSLQSIGSAIQMLAQAKKAGAEEHVINITANEELKKLHLYNEGQELANAYQGIVNKYADQRNREEINKLIQQVNNLTQQAVLNTKIANVQDALAEVYKEQVTLIKNNAALSEKQKELLIKDINNYDLRLRLENALTRAKTFNENASGQEHVAGAQYKGQLTEESYWNTRDKIVDFLVHSRSMDALINKAMEEAKLTADQRTKVQAEAAKLGKEVDYYEIEIFLDVVKAVAPSMFNLLGDIINSTRR